MEAIESHCATTQQPVQQILVHTGQHYTPELSKLLFDDLGLPVPDINLNIGSGSHGAQTGKVMIAFEEVLVEQKPDVMVVVGDVNSTIACALDAVKLGVPVAHVEAGLRSFDRQMPEEINRILTDQISDWLFTTEEGARDHLLREGIAEDKIHFVGNVMIDTLLIHREKAMQSPVLGNIGHQPGSYAVATLHRPSNVDDPCNLKKLVNLLIRVSQEVPLVWPVHPRTRQKLDSAGLMACLEPAAITLMEPQGYLDSMCLTANARVVLTDSGGVQEETTILRVPCITMRENTERPVTIHQGTNVLAGTDPDAVWDAFLNHPAYDGEDIEPPRYWDGQAGARIAQILMNEC